MFVRSALLGSVGIAMLIGCSAPAAEPEEREVRTTKPHLLALSTYEASLGSPIDAFIANPPDATARKIELVFDGVFKRADGREENVAITQPTNRTEAGAVRWTSFGPFANPFVPKDPDVGVFSGKVGVKVTLADGTETMDESPIPIQFVVKPSIIVTELQPASATCDKPALRLIGGIPYKMTAKTIGFHATSFEYSVKTPSLGLDASGRFTIDTRPDGSANYKTTLIQHAVGENAGKGDQVTDKIDANDALALPPMPADRPSYGVVFTIAARDDAGRTVRSTFAMTAHNPVEIAYDGRYELAQIYPVQPVSACMPGGQQGRTVDYIESKSESRQRQLTMTMSKNWLKADENTWSTSDGRSVTRSTTETEGYSRSHGTSNTFEFTEMHSYTSGFSFNWSDATTVSSEVKVDAKAGFPGIGEFGAEVKEGVGVTSTTGKTEFDSSTSGWSRSNSSTTSTNDTRSQSTATTDESTVNHTETRGGSETAQEGGGQNQSDAWTVSSTDTIQRGFGGQVLAGTYGVFYRQLARYTRKAFVLEYTKCGESEVIGDVTLQDYVWAPDLAISNHCPPLPKSNLPEAQCYLPPCDP